MSFLSPELFEDQRKPKGTKMTANELQKKFDEYWKDCEYHEMGYDKGVCFSFWMLGAMHARRIVLKELKIEE